MVETLKVAVVGAGPAGMYVADALVFQQDFPVRVDVFDRLPTPFGLLRYGVAPDHLKMKALASALQRTLDDERVRFLGNVEVGRDITVEELRTHYSAVVYTFGASTDRRLDIPGEDLPGSASATEFVNWYSGHPDVPCDRFDLRARTAVVVGVGNVAVDVARILVKDVDELASTDLPTDVVKVLRDSAIADVHLLGRRGPLQAKFTHKELRELGELTGVDVLVDPNDLALSDEEVDLLEAEPALQRNLDTLREWSAREPSGAARRLHLHFYTRPVELVGPEAVTGVVIERTALDSHGRAVPTGQSTLLPAQLVLRSVGYRGVALVGVPLDEGTGTVPHELGRVVRNGAVSPGEYVAGWVGRGPVGVLGTNRADAEVVVERLLADAPELKEAPDVDVREVLTARGIDVVGCDGWNQIDSAEIARGRDEGRRRSKLATWGELLSAARI